MELGLALRVVLLLLAVLLPLTCKPIPQRRGRVLVDRQVVAHDDAVGGLGLRAREIAVAHVLRDELGLPLERVAEAAPYRRVDPDRIAGLERHVREPRTDRLPLLRPLPLEIDAVGRAVPAAGQSK